MSTRLQDETWILVGKDKRDELIKEFEQKYGIEWIRVTNPKKLQHARLSYTH